VRACFSGGGGIGVGADASGGYGIVGDEGRGGADGANNNSGSAAAMVFYVTRILQVG